MRIQSKKNKLPGAQKNAQVTNDHNCLIDGETSTAK